MSADCLATLADLIAASVASRDSRPSRYESDVEYSDCDDLDLDDNTQDVPLVPGVDGTQPLPVALRVPDAAASRQEFAAIFSASAPPSGPAPSTSAAPAQADAGFTLDKLGLAWGACYMRDDVPGPAIDSALASLLTSHVRNRLVDEELKKLMADVSVPANCPNLVVPLLNKELEEVFESKSAKICERTLAKITAITCKAMAPVLGVLNDLLLKNVSLPTGNSEALSNSLIMLSSIINIASHGRKQNLQHTVNEPLLRLICSQDTKVGEKYLFDFDVGEKLAALRKARRIGRPSRFRSPGRDRRRRSYDS
ncbi:MAG: hypothetical protein AAGJ80_19815, partial [Cyanobacteria bacterium J06553_1]